MWPASGPCLRGFPARTRPSRWAAAPDAAPRQRLCCCAGRPDGWRPGWPRLRAAQTVGRAAAHADGGGALRGLGMVWPVEGGA